MLIAANRWVIRSYSTPDIPGASPDDEVSLAARPLVPAIVGRLWAVAERACNRFEASAREDHAVSGDRLPPTQPRRERRHDREFR